MVYRTHAPARAKSEVVSPRAAPARGDATARTSLFDRVTWLQRIVGNRAVTALLGVQRHVGPTTDADVGTEPEGGGTGTGTGSAPPAGLDFDALARRIQRAIEGLGTDEAAVYGALGQLNRQEDNIEGLKAAYQAITGRSLIADIRDDFSSGELRRAEQLLTPMSRQELIEAAMRRTVSGQWALGVIARHSIEVEWSYEGTGSFHRAGKIFLNKNKPPNAAAITMMHEAQHALTFKTGAAADINELSRDEYVAAKIADEAEAVVRSIEGAAPMQRAGMDLTGSSVGSGTITRYQRAYNRRKSEIRDAEPEIGEADLHRRARNDTRDNEVTSWFHDGTFVTSTGGITYSDHYGGAWDRAHEPPESTDPATLPAAEAPRLVDSG